jgi:hypothetical protein
MESVANFLCYPRVGCIQFQGLLYFSSLVSRQYYIYPSVKFGPPTEEEKKRLTNKELDQGALGGLRT